MAQAEDRSRDAAVEVEWIRTILRQAPVVLFAFDARGTVMLSEGGGLRRIGRHGGQRVGCSLFDLHADNPTIVDAVRRVLAGEAVSTTIALGGEWYTTELVPLRDPSGAVSGGVGLAIEVGARMALGDLVNSLDVITWIADAATLRVSFVNERAVRLLGYPVTVWLEPTFFERHLQPDERALTLSLWRQVAADGVERSCVHRVLRADGRAAWFRTTVRGLRRHGGPVRTLIAIMLEVTERVGSQTILAESEKRFRLMFEQLPAVVYTTDRELRFTSGAGSGLTQLGLRQDHTLHGISLYEYFHTGDPSHPIVAAHRRAVAGESVDYETTWLGRTFRTHVDPFRDPRGEIIGAIGVALDITERKRAEEERDRLLAQERMARAAAEEAVRVRDEFLSVASHELFTPLTALQLALQGLERGYGNPGEREQFIATAERQARRLIKLVGDLLNVSRIQSGRLDLTLEDVELGGLARDVVARFSPELSRTRTPLRLAAAAPVIGRWDRSRLDQVITNLLSNALKYAAGKPIDLTVEGDRRRAWLRVRDHGVGIPEADRGRIFERFARAVPTRHHGGLGLGLFIVRSIVEAHGGSVRAERAPGGGALFTVELPTAPPPRS